MIWWVIYSVVGALGFAAANIADKYIVNKHTHQPLVVASISGLVSLFFGAFITLFVGDDVSIYQILSLLFIGALNQFAAILYFFALAREEVSRVVPIFYTSPLITLILALFLFGEKVTAKSFFLLFY